MHWHVHFCVGLALAKVESGEDFRIVVEDGNILEDYSDKMTYKKMLQYIGRKDLATKLEIYLAKGQSFCLILLSKLHHTETAYGFV